MAMSLLHVVALAPVFAMAPQSGGDPGSSMISTVIMFGSIILIFYFMILRPQKKRQDEQQKLMDGIKKGDKVVLASGIHGTISSVDERTVLLQIADNVRIHVEKSALTTVTSKDLKDGKEKEVKEVK
jgi:preprotein translocase subunit YajC